MIKFIHPKTEVIREVAESNSNKKQILERAGFIPFENYRAPKKPVVVPDPTVADGVKQHEKEAVDPDGIKKPVNAIHASVAAKKMIERKGLDAAFIEGSGKDGQITKPDVVAYIKLTKSLEAEMKKNEEADQVKLVDQLNTEAGNVPRDDEKEDTQPDAGTEEESQVEAVQDGQGTPQGAADILTHDDDPALPEVSDPIVRDATEEEEAQEAEYKDPNPPAVF